MAVETVGKERTVVVEVAREGKSVAIMTVVRWGRREKERGRFCLAKKKMTMENREENDVMDGMERHSLISQFL